MKNFGEIELIYEDPDLLVVNKPSGILTMADHTGEQTVYSIVTDYVKSRNRSGRIFIVHRLDRDTSGLLLFARNADTKYAIQEHWDEAVLERKYVAVVSGHPNPSQGRIVSYLKDNPKSFKVSSSWADDGGKKAITNYSTLKSGSERSLVEFELETGRKNQIRVHSSLISCPIVGDKKYGYTGAPSKRLMLHALSLVFKHPWTGEILSFDTGVPRGFLKSL